MATIEQKRKRYLSKDQNEWFLYPSGTTHSVEIRLYLDELAEARYQLAIARKVCDFHTNPETTKWWGPEWVIGRATDSINAELKKEG